MQGAASDHGRGLIVYASGGDHVQLDGSPLQCLAFGPLNPPLRQGRTGVVCFVGSPRQKLEGTWAAWIGSNGGVAANREVEGDLARIFTDTAIGRTKHLPRGHALKRVGTGLACKYGAFNAGRSRKVLVSCFRLARSGRFIPGSATFALSTTELVLGKTTPAGHLAVTSRLPHR